MTPDPSGASYSAAEDATAEDAVTVGSLCSGYGGLDLGLALALGVPVRHAWHVEYDKHPSAILAHHWSDVTNYGDVKLAPWHDMEPVDWLTAGYPCQPFSLAGLRKGADDPRHLWPGVARAIGVLRPRRVLLENVAAHLRDGFDVVLADLAAMGYDASWGVVRASDAGAPHGRARLFVVGTDAAAQRRRWTEGQQRGLGAAGLLPHTAPDSEGGSWRAGQHGAAPEWVEGDDQPRRCGSSADAAGHGWREGRAEPAWEQRGSDAAERGAGVSPDADSAGSQRRESARGLDVPAWGAYEPAIRRWERVTGRSAPRPTEPGRTGERLSPRFVEWLMGLSAGWVTDVPQLPRNAQLKALGNGVVPQQAALAIRLLTATAAAEVAA